MINLILLIIIDYRLSLYINLEPILPLCLVRRMMATKKKITFIGLVHTMPPRESARFNTRRPLHAGADSIKPRLLTFTALFWGNSLRGCSNGVTGNLRRNVSLDLRSMIEGEWIRGDCSKDSDSNQERRKEYMKNIIIDTPSHNSWHTTLMMARG